MVINKQIKKFAWIFKDVDNKCCYVDSSLYGTEENTAKGMTWFHMELSHIRVTTQMLEEKHMVLWSLLEKLEKYRHFAFNSTFDPDLLNSRLLKSVGS